MKGLLICVVGIVALFVLIAIFACIKMSSDLDREEEQDG